MATDAEKEEMEVLKRHAGLDETALKGRQPLESGMQDYQRRDANLKLQFNRPNIVRFMQLVSFIDLDLSFIDSFYVCFQIGWD